MQPQRHPRARPSADHGSRSASTTANPAGGNHWYEIDIQHADLGALLDSLAATLGAVANDPNDVGTRVEMLRLLVKLEHQLLEHFDYEEANGYLAEALAVAPRLTRRAKRLRGEHSHFLGRIRTLVNRTRETGESPGSWTALATGVRKLTYELRFHELEENRLVQDAFMDDLGGG
jgi:iron-sulfur cluster repair protein YtfE (RIC family)